MVVGYHSNISLTPPTRASSHTVTQSVGHVVWGAQGMMPGSYPPSLTRWVGSALWREGPPSPGESEQVLAFAWVRTVCPCGNGNFPGGVRDLTKTRPRGFRDASPSCPRRVLVGSWSCPFPVPSRTCPVQDMSPTGPLRVLFYRYLRPMRWRSCPSWRRGGIRRPVFLGQPPERPAGQSDPLAAVKG